MVLENVKGQKRYISKIIIILYSILYIIQKHYNKMYTLFEQLYTVSYISLNWSSRNDPDAINLDTAAVVAVAAAAESS